MTEVERNGGGRARGPDLPGSMPGLVALSLYAILLVAAAWPAALLPTPLEPLGRASYRLLDSLRLRPGQAVFLGAGPGDRKIRAWCLAVLGSRGSGPLEVLYRPDVECFPRSFVARRQRYYQTFQELLNVSSRAWTSRGGERVNAVYGLIADHFCRSPLSPAQGLERVVIVEHRVFTSYRTGEIARQLIHAYDWHCATASPSPRPWSPVPTGLVLPDRRP